MPGQPTKRLSARCACGSVELEATGDPITSTVCYCESCQQGSRQIEALPNGRSVCGSDGGTAYVLYRKDRIEYSKGSGVSTAPGPQAQGRIVDQAGCRLLLRFAHVPGLRERALVVGIPNGVAGGCAAPGDARPHKVQARGQCSSERRAQLLRVFPEDYGEALWRLDRDAASSVSSERRSLTHPSAWKVTAC